jgi:hypothetical protein
MILAIDAAIGSQTSESNHWNSSIPTIGLDKKVHLQKKMDVLREKISFLHWGEG